MNISLKTNWLFSLLSALAVLASSLAVAYTVPEEVKNVTVSEQDGAVAVTWEAGVSAEDVVIGYNIYYGTTPVETPEDVYEDQVFVSTQTNYLFENLEKGTPYYFAITAVDSQENESATYSPEVSFTLAGGEVIEPEAVLPEVEVEEISIPSFDEGQFVPGETAASENEADLMAPLDATGMTVDAMQLDTDGTISIGWMKSRNLDYDAYDQVLYVKVGHDDWDTGTSLGKDLESFELAVEQNQNYEVRLVTIDESGNQSAGVNQTFSTALTESGANTTLISTMILLGLAVVFMFSLRRRS